MYYTYFRIFIVILFRFMNFSKKILITFSFVVCLFSVANGQAWDGIGDKKLGVGASIYGSSNSGIIANFDYGILPSISMGVGTNLYFYENTSDVFIHARGNYHFQSLFRMPSVVDLYVGVNIGYSTTRNGLGYGAHLGARWMFTDAVGFFIEVGDIGNTGLIFNF